MSLLLRATVLFLVRTLVRGAICDNWDETECDSMNDGGCDCSWDTSNMTCQKTDSCGSDVGITSVDYGDNVDDESKTYENFTADNTTVDDSANENNVVENNTDESNASGSDAGENMVDENNTNESHTEENDASDSDAGDNIVDENNANESTTDENDADADGTTTNSAASSALEVASSWMSSVVVTMTGLFLLV